MVTLRREITALAFEGFADLGCYSRRSLSGLTKLAATLAGFAAHQVAGAGTLKLDLAPGPNLHTLGNTLVRFHFRHKNRS